MTYTLSTSSRLIWKEWRELRWFLIVPLTLFLGMALVEAYANMSSSYQPGFRTDLPVGLNGGFGAMLAIFIAVAATTRDLRDELKVFWQSRPISTGRSLVIKFAVGLLVLLAVCIVPLVLQIVLGWRASYTSGVEEALLALSCHTPLLVLIYSISFVFGCFIRQATHAAMLSLAAAVLVYALPTLIPPLGGFSALHLMNDNVIKLASNTPGWKFNWPMLGTVTIKPAYLPFVAAMAAISGGMLLLSLWIVRRDWRAATDHRFVVWSLGIVVLLIFSTLAFAVGSNIPAERQTELPMPNQSVAAMAGDGERGVILMRDNHRIVSKWTRTVPVRVASFARTSNGVTFGPALALPDEINLPNSYSGNPLFWRPEHPDRAYLLVERNRYVEQPRQVTATRMDHYETEAVEIHTIDLTGKSKDPVIHRINLLDLLPIGNEAWGYRLGSKIYVAGADRIAVIDLSNPDAPTVTVPAEWIDSADHPGRGPTAQIYWSIITFSTTAAGREVLDVVLPTIPELTPRQRLELKFGLLPPFHGYAYGDDLLAIADSRRLSTYRLISIDESNAHFELIGRRAHTPLERLTDRRTRKLEIQDDRVFCVEDGANTSIAVYSTDRSQPPQRLGHFAVPREIDFALFPLSSGGLLVGGDRLYELDLSSDATSRN